MSKLKIADNPACWGGKKEAQEPDNSVRWYTILSEKQQPAEVYVYSGYEVGQIFWAQVPIEPTEAMLKAGYEAILHRGGLPHEELTEDLKAVWTAMLKAASKE